jgi:hypothetical protein
MGNRDRFNERIDDDLPTCRHCHGILIRPESVSRGVCLECFLSQPVKPFDRPLGRTRRK